MGRVSRRGAAGLRGGLSVAGPAVVRAPAFAVVTPGPLVFAAVAVGRR